MTPPGKVLVVVLDNLGDTVMATAVLRPLKRALPGARIGMFVKRYAGDILADHSLIDRLHLADPFWDASPGQKRGGVAAYLKAAFAIRREGYDAALLLNTEFRRAFTALAAGIPTRVGYQRRWASDFLTIGLPPTDGKSHFIVDHRRLVEALTPVATAEEFTPRLEVSQEDAGWADTWRNADGWTNARPVAIHPFSGDERKNWPLDRWPALVERLGRAGAGPFVVFCSSAEKLRLANWSGRAAPLVRFVAGAPLRQVKALLSRSSLLIGGDSGLGHVAAALGTPVLSLFGPGSPGRSGPVGRGAVRVIQKNPLETLDLAEVESAALSLLTPAAAEERE